MWSICRASDVGDVGSVHVSCSLGEITGLDCGLAYWYCRSCVSVSSLRMGILIVLVLW